MAVTDTEPAGGQKAEVLALAAMGGVEHRSYHSEGDERDDAQTVKDFEALPGWGLRPQQDIDCFGQSASHGV
jgi:hypothetical protein